MINRIAGRHIATITVAAWMTGCASLPASSPQKPVDPVAEKLDAYIFEDGSVRHEVTDETIANLWREYKTMYRAGNLVGAKGKLQEAITIAPTDPALWSGAAELELKENSHLRAENYAAKSNFLAPIANRPLRYRNWLIIQRAREGRGDLLGAREAEIESTKLIQ